MTRTLITAMIAGGLMAMSAAGAKYLTPTHHMSQSRPSETLEHMIPARFGSWKQENTPIGGVVDPQIEEQLRRIYTQIVTRTYVNDKGERVMLSVAYGTDQSDSSQVHYPEVCYPAQGFQLTSNEAGTLPLGNRNLPVRRLQANFQKQRFEPITYWTTVGDQVVISKMDKKMVEMRYSLDGIIPDGLLFRVSSIDTDSSNAFRVQEDFVRAMAGSLSPVAHMRLLGSPTQ
jgi:EpsI family protein